MSNSYSIYLSNQYGSTNTYGYFTSPPISSEEAGQVYANVWISEVLADSGEVEIHISKNYWACECVHTSSRIRPGSFTPVRVWDGSYHFGTRSESLVRQQQTCRTRHYISSWEYEMCSHLSSFCTSLLTHGNQRHFPDVQSRFAASIFHL